MRTAIFVALCLLAGSVTARVWAWDGGHPGIVGCNPQRTGYAPFELRPPYRALWVYRARHKPRPAWPEPAWEPQRIDFDYAYAVSVDGDCAYYASSSDHALHALELNTGRPRWKFITDGPVRLAPDVHGSHVLFGSDDGFVYCLGRSDGRLVWKHRPEIPDRRMIGNEQMISRWPVRSGVLVEGDRVYAAYGMLAAEGVAVCCLDAATGRRIWINDTCGIRYMARPHQTTMGGVAPQGYLAVCGDRLVVTCGRSTPALFDKHTGECLYHEADGDFTGGAWTMTAPGLVFTPADTLAKEFGAQLRRSDPAAESEVFELATLVALDAHSGREVFSLRGGAKGVLSDRGQLTLIGRQQLLSFDLDDVRGAIGKATVIKHTLGHFVEGEKICKWAAPVDRVYALLQAGDTIIAGGRDAVGCFDASSGRRLWEARVQGQVRAMSLAAGHLLVSTTEGLIYCFVPAEKTAPAPDPATSVAVESVVSPATTGESDRPHQGYCLVAGESDAARLRELAKQYDLVLYAATYGDAAALRAELDAAGLYGTHVVVHRLEGPSLPYTDYFANAIYHGVTSRDALQAISLAEVYRLLRPCGGVAHIRCPAELAAEVRRLLVEAGVPEAEIAADAEGLRIVRGPLAGAGQWTHQYGDPGKRVASDEQRVRLPLKAAWIGGLGPATLVSRHFREPAPLVIDGRCFVPGTDHLTAMDIYNGRTLWQRELPELAHWPAAYRGPSLAVDHQAVYALQKLECWRLDPANGQTLGKYRAPQRSDAAPGTDDVSAGSLEWEFLAVVGDVILGTLGRANVKREWWSKAYPVNEVLFAIDKQSGAVRWTHRPQQGIDSNAIAVEGSRVFVIDGPPQYSFLKKEKRRGANEASAPRRLRALDLATGEVLWEHGEIVPTLNSLWAADGVVVASQTPFGRVMVDPGMAKDGGGITGYSVRDGKRLWRIDSVDQLAPFISQGVFYTPVAHDLQTGNPLPARAGGEEPFSAGLSLLCGTLAGCPTTAMARQSSLGFRDLLQQGGVYQYPVVRSSCWINMIPAGGLIVVPEGGSSCMCAYNYKTSLALMSDDRHFHFGIGGSGLPGRPGLRLNFGAPGDRPDADGQMWFAYPRPVAYGRCLGDQPYGPKVAGPALPVEEQAGTFYRTWGRNPDWMTIGGSDKPWRDSFGLEGPIRLVVRVPDRVPTNPRFCVQLSFCELDEPPAPRVFDVKLQGRTVLAGMNVVREAGGPRRALTKQFTLDDAPTLTLELTRRSADGSPPIISGLAILAAKNRGD